MTDDPNRPGRPGAGDLEAPFLFVPHGAPEPAEWMRRHPGWVRFPATFVPHAPAGQRTVPGTNRPWPVDKRGQPWPRSRFGQPLRPLDEYPPGVRAPGEGYAGPIADPDKAVQGYREFMAAGGMGTYDPDPDAPAKAYLAAKEVYDNLSKHAGYPPRATPVQFAPVVPVPPQPLPGMPRALGLDKPPSWTKPPGRRGTAGYALPAPAPQGDIERLIPNDPTGTRDPGFTAGTLQPPPAGTSIAPDSVQSAQGGFAPAPGLPNVEQGPSAEGPREPQLVENRGDPGLTRPTGPINAVPGGARSTTEKDAIPNRKVQVDSENGVGDLFAAAGYRTVQNPTKGANPLLTPERLKEEGLRPDADPDLLVEDRVFDVYSPEKDDAASIRTGIQRKIDRGQTHRVAVDLRGTTQTEVSVRAAIRANPLLGVKEVVVITHEGMGRPFRP